MEEQKIAKNRQHVIFTLADSSQIEGEVFLNLYEAHGRGQQRVGALLNGEGAFLPVKTIDGTVHLNVANIIKACTSIKAECCDLMMLGKKYTVQITTLNGEKIKGEIFVDLPNERSRVSDHFNQLDRFFRVFTSDQVVYISSHYILTVRD